MSSVQGARGELSQPWQRRAGIQLLAAVLGVIPLYSSAVMVQVRHGLSISVEGFIVYLSVISPISIVVAFLLLRFLCGERLRELNLSPGSLPRDLLATLILSVVVLAANVASTSSLSALFPDASANSSVRDLFIDLAGDPKLLALFLGLLVFLGAASEELIRAFLLSRLWRVWGSSPAKLGGVAISALLFGLIHLYQGPIHVASAAIFGLVMALYYLRFGRVVPMILAHYVTNALQIAVFAFAAR